MFINISRYGSCTWGEEWHEEAKKYGKIVDLTAPNVNPEASPLEVWDIAKGLLDNVWDLQHEYSLPCTMICLGGIESTLMYAVVRLFLEHGLKVCRAVERENEDGLYEFVRFREFINHNIYEDENN